MKRALLVAVLALSACGGGDPDGTTPGAEPKTDLTILVYPEGPGQAFAQWELECDPAGGTLPDAAGACDRLATAEDPFAPPPENVACTEQYGGPQMATVTGTLDGEAVNARLTRTDGCQIARWDEVAFLLPEDDGT